MNDSLEVEVLYPAWWWWRISEAQGRHREVASERSVEQSRGLMDKNRLTRPTRSHELADDREVVNPAGVRRRRSFLPREISGASGKPDWAARKAR